MRGLARALRVFPAFLRVGLAESVAYRAEMLVWMLTSTMPLVSLALWSAVSRGAPVGRFDGHAFASYYLATLVVRQLTGSWVVWEVNHDIRSGELSPRLLKPVHPLVGYGAGSLALLPMRALLTSPVALIALWVIGAEDLPADATTLASWAVSLVGAWLINFFAMAAIGACAFFLESSLALFDVWLLAFTLLSGYLIPLELFPPALRAALDALPFRYTLGFPVEILTGRLEPLAIARGLGVQWSYVAATGGAALLLWRAGLRRFAAFGG